MGLASSVELCVKALQLPKKEDAETRISVCRTISCVLQEDLEVLRACQLTEFLLGPCQDAFGFLEELYLRPDQKYDQENPIIPNSLRCELLLALKAHWPFDPEFWDWKTLKYHCSGLLGLEPESQEEGRLEGIIKHVEQVNELGDGSTLQTLNMLNSSGNGQEEEQGDRKSNSTAIAQSKSKSKKPKFFCQICERLVSATQILHHSKRHVQNNIYTCPICLETFQIRKDFICHTKQLHQMALTGNCEKANRRIGSQDETDEKEVKPVQSSVDPSLMLPHQATHDMPPPHHIVEQTKSATVKQTDKDEHVTFEYINTYFPLQNHDRYWCPASRCTKMFKHSKNLYIHLKAEHKGDQNVEHYYKMRDRREKCVFCRRHFVSSYHLRKHQKVHLTDDPFMCVSVGCNSRFSFTNDLVSHRQTHGYQLNYQCELKGCYATFSDLAHLFHHEAQHFRDAAFSCTSPDCKKFFFSKKEFTEHLARHGITYTEEDFETQRKSKLKLLKIVIANSLRAKSGSSKKLSDSLTVLEDTNKSSDLASSSSSSASLSNVPNSNEEMNMTPVAVCFDGSKFTCGFEKCGMTFSRARDVQRHLNCAHPEHLRSENKEHKKRDKEKGSNSKVPKLKTQQNDVEKSKYDHIHTSKGSDPEKILSMPPNNNETTSGLAPYDSLNDILIGLCSLNLNSPCFENEPCDSTHSDSESSTLQISIHQTVSEKSQVAMFCERVSKESMSREQEINLNNFEILYTKPYTCEFTQCSFRTSVSTYLVNHYMNKHNQTPGEARVIGKLQSPGFKPFVCHICSSPFKEKRHLKSHYMKAHKVHFEGFMDPKNVLRQEPKRKCMAPLKPKHHLWAKEDLKVRKREKPNWQQRYQKRKVSMRNREKKMFWKFGNKNMTFQKNPPSEEEEEKEEDEVNVGEYDADEVECIKKLEHQSDVKSSEKGRDTMHLVSKSNLCYILTQYRKPFHCLVEDCVAAFTDQDGLVRHLKTVHNYSRSQLALENDLDFTARPPPTLLSDEPLSQYRCGFASCDASFLLKSSLVRHTLENHCQPSDQVRCMYEGCTRVFDQLFKLRKHILHSHSRYYDSYVLRLQSTHKKSISGCQKKLIVTLPSGQTDSEEETTKQSLRLSPKSEGGAWSEEMVKEEERDLPPRNGNIKPVIETCDDFIYRSHEEALQMCQDRCLRDAYPCMVQNCDSVVKFDSSLRRHYLKVHRMTLPYYVSNEDKLLFTAEQLEELIQRKSAQLNSTVAHAPNGVLKMEYQAEPEKPGGPSVPMSLHSIKTEPCDEDNHNSLGFTEEAPPVKTNVLVGADDLLYGEPNTGGQTHEPLATQNNLVQEEKHRWQSTNPPVIPPIVDLSPPSSLRFTIDDCFVDMSSSKDGGRMPNTPAQQPTAPVRQPLKRKNELSAHQSNLKDSHPHSHPSLSFDIATYKPMGFESSFLKFIQETTPTKEQDTLRCRDSYKRSCSVKENNQMGITLTRSKRTKTAPQKPLPITGDSISAQNLQSILDKSLTGCGDMAIKQLQHLRPVVVLERPTASTFVSDHFPKITNDGKLIFGS